MWPYEESRVNFNNSISYKNSIWFLLGIKENMKENKGQFKEIGDPR